MDLERKFRLQMTVRERDLQTIFELLHDVARDFRMLELREDDPRSKLNGVIKSATAYQEFRKHAGGQWASKLWPMIEPIFQHEKQRGDGLIRYDDPRLKDILVKTGNSPTTVTPLLSELRKQGLISRPHRGWYMLAA